MDKKINITLAYLLAFLSKSWFWLGIWVFYYLKFTDYAGIGLIETILITTTILGEIPTGAVADLLGKKKTLILGFLLQAICQLLFGLAGNFNTLIMAVFIGGLGGTFNSGAFEALIYDTLKEKSWENRFDKVIANTNTLGLISIAIFSSLGGFMYIINPRLPFLASGLTYFIAFLACFFLKEPAIDSQVFNWKTFVKQNKQGLIELKHIFKVEKLAWLIVSVSSLYVISDEMLESVLGVEFGFSQQQLGIFFALLFVSAAFLSQLTPLIRKKIGDNRGTVLITAIMGFTYLITPFVNRFAGGASMFLREGANRNLENFASIILNRQALPQYRATMLSTFNMFKNLPYVLTAFILGSLMDAISGKNFAFILGIIITLLTIFQAGVFFKARKKIT